MLFSKTIADTTHCFDQSPQFAQLLAESGDLNINRPLSYGVVRSLNRNDNLLAGTGNASMACEEVQKQKLGLRQLDRSTLDTNLALRRINDDTVRLNYGVVFGHVDDEATRIGMPTGLRIIRHPRLFKLGKVKELLAIG